MKNSLHTVKFALLLLALLPLSALAQSEMLITWTGTPGEFETTILADTLDDGTQAHEVYILEKGKVYLQIDELSVNSSFTVRGQEYDATDPADVPATIQPFPGADGTSRYVTWPGGHFQMYGDNAHLTLENLLFNGAMPDQSTHVWSIVNPRGKDQKVTVDNNVWSDYQISVMTAGVNTDLHINNTVFKSVPSYPGGVFFNGFVWGGGSWLGTIDTLMISNSSVVNSWGEALVIYEQVNHGVVDHSTFANIVMDPIWYRGGNNMEWKNNLFYNTKVFGQSTHWFGLWGSVEGGHGVMHINDLPPPDSTALAAGRTWDSENRNIYWHHNAWANDEQVLDFWANGGPYEWEASEVVDGDTVMVTRRDTMLAVELQNVWVADSALAIMAADPTIREHDNVQTTATLQLDPKYLEKMIERIIDFRDNEVFDTFTTEWWQYDPDENPTNVQWPMHEDLRYAMNSPAARASETGGPVGDPRWSPEGIVSNEDDIVPRSFTLDQNYPNPFNPSTEIAFTLNKAATVQLDVYNSLGQLVKQLVSQPLPAATHLYSWDATNGAGVPVSGGVYIYKLTTGEHSVSKKMTLIK